MGYRIYALLEKVVPRWSRVDAFSSVSVSLVSPPPSSVIVAAAR